jgi:hypothetical protein
MDVSRLLRTSYCIWGIAGCLLATGAARAADQPSGLKTAAADAERIVIAIPELKGAKEGRIEVPPGGRIAIEVQSELRGTGNKSILLVNGGTASQYPRYLNGKTYIFLLKRNPEGKGWLNLGNYEIPLKNGKVQWLADGKIAEEMPLAEFEELAAAKIEPVADKIPTRDTLTGNWVFTRSDNGTNLYLWLLELKPREGGETSVRVIGSNKRIEATSLKSAEIKGAEVHFVLSTDGATLDFQGRFLDGVVRGSIVGGSNPMAYPARLEPTDETTMKKYEDPAADPLYQEFVQSVSKDNPIGALTRFVRRHPLSSLTINAFQTLVSQSAHDRVPLEKFENLAEEYRTLAAKWGARLELQALVDVGVALSVKDHLPELSLTYLTEAQQKFSDDTPVELKKAVAIERGRRLIAAGQGVEGAAVLSGVRADHPFDPMVLYSLAKQAEKDKRTDEALELYAELQVLPMLEQTLIDAVKSSGQKLPVDQYPRRVVARLWIEKHGDGKGLPEWLEALYNRRIRALGGERRAPRTAEEGNRVVLIELFTGTASQQSIAAEAAVSSLQAGLGETELVVLRYHIQEPGPDPLGNAECQERFKMYLGQNTPVLTLNGRRQVDPVGPLFQSPIIYRRLRDEIDLFLKEQTDLKIALTAQANQGKITISAKATGLPDFPASIRLVVVLAEDKIDMQAKNGIRVHEMVVRAMPAGLGGAAANNGVLEFSGEVKIDKVRNGLIKFLAEKEADAEAPFDVKPPLALNPLHAVAFLQNTETGEVYQVVSVPVAGLRP